MLDASWKYTGNTGFWAPVTADAELGYFYIATESPTNDYYGGYRPGENLFGNSVLALKAETGELAWHFQSTHHELWDYDLPTAPISARCRRERSPGESAGADHQTGLCPRPRPADRPADLAD